ncbi:HAMP domain-containing sensor histidine kinase [Olsenella sp. HMSC062G07]|uniref:HAMP domain-containing sensor histidine kinase n=1 Tax=Olsenella sp. HMSC062G07 TaxID=1739330 RepID=UPI0008A63899|nr:HAMP domain-containing sensor histidine kinase [Olsenella sp. HMSC062G07]OFK22814.1 two-component sensor histidine kinase [Olsenella sp. HMSC062G07]
MRRLSLQWRITLMTALLLCLTCVLMNCLIGYLGMRSMESIGTGLAAHGDVNGGDPTSFDPASEEIDHELTIVVSDAQESFGTASWCITAAMTLLGGILAYFVSGCALRPLRSFAAQVENVRPDNLADMKITEDVPLELARCSASFNDMIDRLDEGFVAQRQFTGNAAHELRTPLALMQAQMELFCSEHPDAQPDTAGLLGLLQEQTERMSQMTRTLLEMSELRSVPCNDLIELAPMVEEVLADLAPLAEQRGIALACDGDAQVLGSDTLLYRMLFNLTENAIRYSRADTAVSVSVRTDGDCARVRVKDSGHGIPSQYQKSVFQPFFRIDTSRSRAYGGVGLGLSLVWEIVSLHGGTIEVERSSEDGTTMLVTLPRG